MAPLIISNNSESIISKNLCSVGINPHMITHSMEKYNNSLGFLSWISISSKLNRFLLLSSIQSNKIHLWKFGWFMKSRGSSLFFIDNHLILLIFAQFSKLLISLRLHFGYFIYLSNFIYTFTIHPSENSKLINYSIKRNIN